MRDVNVSPAAIEGDATEDNRYQDVCCDGEESDHHPQ